MSVEARVLALFVSVDTEIKRVSRDKLELDANGVLNDKFYAKKKDRLILVTSVAAYALAKDCGVELKYGSLGENILVDQNINSLVPGNQFMIGEVTVEVTQNCTLCKGLSTIDSKLPEILKNDRGLFVKAITNGAIKKEDLVII